MAAAWTKPAHINVLELQALLIGLRWRLRSSKAIGSKICCFLDSQVALSVAALGRPSPHQLNRALKRLNAFCLAAHIQPFYLYVHTSRNPADAPFALGRGEGLKSEGADMAQ